MPLDYSLENYMMHALKVAITEEISLISTDLLLHTFVNLFDLRYQWYYQWYYQW
jgi:hypothetical protein